MAQNESAVHPEGTQLNPQLEEQIKLLIKSQIEELVLSNQETNSSMDRTGRKELKEKNSWTEIFVPAIPVLTAIIVAVWFVGTELSLISADLEALKDRTDRMEMRMEMRFDRLEELSNKRFDRLEDVLLNPRKRQAE